MPTPFTLNKSIFKAYDIRGIYPTDINEQTVELVAKAYVKLFKPGVVVLAHDARHGSPELTDTLEESLAAEAEKAGKKFEIVRIGYSTTPMFYFTVGNLKASGGAMVTASHNPKEYNGIKTVIEGAETVSGTDILNLITL